jgi:hypothetical protein
MIRNAARRSAKVMVAVIAALASVACGSSATATANGALVTSIVAVVVRAFRVASDGKPISSVDAFIQEVYGRRRSHEVSSLVGEVVAPNEKVTMVGVKGSHDDVRLLLDALIGTKPGGARRLVAEVCYCSALEQCWWGVTDKEPTRTSSCPRDERAALKTW